MTQESHDPGHDAVAEHGPSDRATTFQAVQGAQPEHYSGEVLLVSAYAILWVILFVWIASIWRKGTRLNERLDELEKVLDRAAEGKDA
jgi:CcmD family protein